MCIFGDIQEEKNSCVKAKSVKVTIKKKQMACETDAGENSETNNHEARGEGTRSILKKNGKGKI